MKKSIILGVSVVLAASTFTSCSSRGSWDGKVLKIEDLTSVYNENNKLEIDFWTGFGSSMTDALETQLELFQLDYPYISVNHEQKGGYDGLHSAVMNSLNSNSFPDLVVGYPDHFADYISSDIQIPLDAFIKDKDVGIDLSIYNSQYMRENQSLDKDGTTYGLPFNKSTEVMVYNKDFFDAFNLTPPTTWDDAITLGKQAIQLIKNNGGFNSSWSYTNPTSGKEFTFDFTNVSESDFYPLSYDSQSNFFITIVRQFGGKYTEMGDSIEKGYIVFKDDPKVIEALEFVEKMAVEDHVLGIPATFNEEAYCSTPFKNLKSIMTISSSAGVPNNIGTSVTRVGVAPIPYKTADKKFVISQGTNLAILDCSNEKALACWLLIRYLTGAVDHPKYNADLEIVEGETANANVDFAIDSGYLPVILAGETSEKYQNYLNETSPSAATQAKKDVQKIANAIYTNEAEKWDKFVDSAFVGSSTIRTEVEKIIPMIIVGENRSTPQQAIDYVYSRLSRFVKK